MADNPQPTGVSTPPSGASSVGGQITNTNSVLPGDPEFQGTTPAIVASAPTAVNAPTTNPNSRGVNDISDIRPTPVVVTLPIRGEKRLIPTKVNATQINSDFSTGFGQLTGATAKTQVKDSDFFVTPSSNGKRLQNGVDFIKIRIPHRGVTPNNPPMPDPTQAVEYRFLVNPESLTVNRQTVDSQSLTRGGWQFGVWGEDTFLVQMQGTSAGSYFSLGTTDEFSYYAVSYRNLMQLQEVFENNGYWFEGEEYNEGPLAADYLRRRIRMHQDVELWVGNFIWFGMFDSFTISQDATQPFMLNFTLSFFVWKEKYRSSSPYWGSIENNVQRGHSYQAVEGNVGGTQANGILAQFSPSAVNTQQVLLNNALNGVANIPYSNNPAVQAANADDLVQTVTPIVSAQIGLQPLQQLTLPSANSASWKGTS